MVKRGVLLVFVVLISLGLCFFAYGSSFLDDSQGEFDLGSYENLTWNGSAIVFVDNNLTGTYTSSIKDASLEAEWTNISWEGSTESIGVSSDNLMIYYKLDESSGEITDYSGNDYQGSYNGALYSQEGYDGNSVGFDGTNDMINTSNSTDLDFGLSDFTIVGWVKRSADSTRGILSKGYWEDDGFSLFFTGGNVLRVRAQYDSISTSTTEGIAVTTSSGWAHIAVVGDRDGNIDFYVNGTLGHSESIVSSSGVSINSSRDFILGNIRREVGGTDYNYQGDMDDFRIYKRALTESEVLTLFNGTSSENNNLNIKVRSCDDSSCDNEEWVGEYGEHDLPDNQSLESSTKGTNMTGNVLLIHFNENVNDSSGAENDGENSGVDFVSEGLFDSAGNFSTGDSVVINDSDNLYLNTGFTIAGWFKDNGSENLAFDLISKYENTKEEWYLSADKGSSGLLRFFLYGNGGNLRRDVSTSDFFDGEWHHVVVTWDGTADQDGIDIYLDGVASDNTGSDSGFSSLNNQESSIRIGKNLELNNADFNGFVDEVAIFNRSLSSTEVYNMYKKSENSYTSSPKDLSVTNNRYFQYQVDFSRDSTSENIFLSSFTTGYNVSLPETIAFVSPTPTNGTTENVSNIDINVSMNNVSLEEFKFNWNGTNYTFFDDSLVFMMNFDNVSGLGENDSYVVDVSGNGNDGYVSSLSLTEGKYRNAFDFSVGDIQINNANENLSLIGTNFTIMSWINPRQVNNNYMILGNNFESGGYQFQLFNGPLTIRTASGPTGALSADTALQTDEWQHVAVTYNIETDTAYFYLNGNPDGNGTLPGTLSSGGGNTFYIGSDGRDGTGYEFNGVIDELKVFNRLLSEEEIQQQYSSNIYQHDENDWIFYINKTGLEQSESYNYQAFVSDESSEYSTEERVFTSGVYEDPPLDSTLTISSPYQHSIFQRNSTNQSLIPIEGIYSGDDSPSYIEARFNGGEWQTLDAAPSGGSFSGNIVGDLGQGVLEVRFENRSDINTTLENIGVGDLYAIAGQSNAEMRGTNSQSYNTSLMYNATTYREDDSWRIANDPVDTGTSIGSSWPLLANLIVENAEVPVGYVAAAAGGSAIVEWQKGTGNYNNLVNQISEATYGTMNVKAVLYFQGERDSSTTGTGCNGNYTCYYAYLEQLGLDITSDTNAEYLVVGQTRFQPSGNRESNDNIRKAQQDGWDDFGEVAPGAITYDILFSADELHFKSDEDLQKKAERWWFALDSLFYTQDNARGPRIQSADFNSKNNLLTLIFNQNLNESSGTEGWRILSDGLTLTDTNILGVSVSGTNVELTLDSSIEEGANISLASYDDGLNKNVLTANNELNIPAEMIFSFGINMTPLNMTFVNPTPENNEVLSVDNFEIKSVAYTNITDLTLAWNGTNYTFFDNQTVLFMNFNNYNLLNDSSQYSNEGSCDSSNNECPSLENGKYNESYAFDGNDKISFEDNDSLDIGLDDFTIEFWVNRDSNGEQGILGKSEPAGTLDSSSGYGLYFSSEDKVVFKAQSWAINEQSSGTIKNTDGWTHIVIVGDRDGNLTFYKNKENVGSADISSSSAININSMYNLTLGFTRITEDKYLTGDIDELRIYKRALSISEVNESYNSNLQEYSEGWNFYSNRTSLQNGNYSFEVFAEEELASISTGQRNIQISVDIYPPFIEFVSPLNQTYNSYNVLLNISSEGENTWWDNGTINSTYTESEYLNLENGFYTFTAYTNDSSGNLNSTTVSFSINSDAPQVSFVSPTTTQGHINKPYITANLTAIDTNLDTLKVYLYNSTNLVNLTSTTEENIILNYTNISEGTYHLNASANDTDGNSYSTQTRTYIYDVSAPIITTIETDVDLPAGTSSYKISFITNENAECRYNTTDTTWGNMSEMPVTDSTQHNLTISVSSGNSYDYFILCRDLYSNEIADSEQINIVVQSSTTTNPSGGSSGSSSSSGGSYFGSTQGLNVEIPETKVIVSEGQEKNVKISVKNKGFKALNKCKLSASEQFKEWIESNELFNIAAGEIADFVFILKVPESVDGNPQPNLSISCVEGNKTIPLEITYIQTEINLELSKLEFITKNELKIRYTIESESSVPTTITYKLLDSNEEIIAEATETMELSAGTQEREFKMDISQEVETGLITIQIFKQGSEQPIIVDDILYDSRYVKETGLLSGLVVGDLLETGSWIVVIVLIFAILAFLIIRRMISGKKKQKPKRSKK